jgi:CBS domain-containing protein
MAEETFIFCVSLQGNSPHIATVNEWKAKEVSMAKTVQDIMTKNPITLAANTPIVEAARAMRDNDIGVVVVENNGQLLGLVTDRDIVIRAIAENRNLSNTTLESICSKDVTSVSPDQSDTDAVQLMRQKSIRRLPVVQNGKVVGILSLGDLAIENDERSVLAQVSAAAGNK